jgi:outer membrane protein insertion porin family
MRLLNNISVFHAHVGVPHQHGSILKSLRISGLLAIAALLTGCNATKFLKEGETFYKGADIRIEPQGDIPGQARVKSSLQTFIIPKPNSKFLGMRTSVWFYYKFETTKKKGLKHTIQSTFGSPPVLLKNATPDKTSKLLQAQLNNDGYFKSTVRSAVETKKKESTVIYTVILQPPFRLRNINYLAFDSTSDVGKGIKVEKLLKKEQRYKLERLEAEQLRIEEVAKNNGLYYFDNRYLLFDADSTVGKRHIDLDLVLERGTLDKSTRKYYVREINVFPSYTLSNDSLKSTGDTVRVNGYNYIDNQHNFRPEIVTSVINLKPDSVYRKINHEYAQIHLMGLQTFKYVNIKFTPSKRDSTALIANVYMTPFLKKSVRVQLEGVSKSNNFVGPGVELTFTNRNIFRGAEQFQIKLHSAYEVQLGNRQANKPLNSFEVGAQAILSVPRFIAPFNIRYGSAKYLPSTQFKIGYDYQERVSYFNLKSFNVSYGYVWRETSLKTHELYPADVTYVQSGDHSKAFDSLLNANPVLKNSFQNQFILGSRYSFTLNTQFTEDVEEKYKLKARKKSNFYFKGTADISGNVLNALQRISASGEKGDSLTIFGSPYSQYVRGDIDFRYYLLTGSGRSQNKIATRLIVGMGNAFGNSTNMPYIKQFSIGGSNSIRAFPARSIGPGTYNVRTQTGNNYFIDQRGDIKLESNVEYRFGIINSFKGAVFVDAGNIWLWNLEEGDKRVGGKFDKNKFLTEIAVGTGFGIRYDFSYFVLRFDLAWPLRKTVPIEAMPGTNKFDWVINKIDFGSADWRSQNLILNVAIGYPF